MNTRSKAKSKKSLTEPSEQSIGSYRIFFDENPLPMWLFDPDSLMFLDVNKAALRRYGYSREEFLNMNVAAIHCPDNLDRLKQALTTFEDAQSTREWCHRLKDESTVDVETTSQLIDWNGKKAIFVVSQDVAGRNQVKGVLKTTQAMFQNLFDSSPDTIVVTNPDGQILQINRQAEAMFGYTAGEVHGRPIEVLIPHHLVEKHIRERVNYMASPRIRPMGEQKELYGLRKDGSEFPVDISLGTMDTEKGLVVLSTIRDITDQRSRDEELRESHERYHRTLDNILEGCQIIDHDWRYVYLNKAAARQAHTTPEKLLGRTMMEAYPGIEKTELFAVLQGCMETREPQLIQNKFENPDGTTGWFELSIEPAKEGIFILSIEVTDRKLAEAGLEKQLAHLNALRQIDIAVLSSFDLRLTLEAALKQIVTELNVDAAHVMLLDPVSTSLNHSAYIGFRTPDITKKRVRLGEGYAGRALLEREVVQVANLRDAQGFAQKELLKGEDFISYVCVPLIAKGRPRGVLEIYHRALLQPEREWLDFLQILAGQTAIALDNASLFNELQRKNAELTLAYETTLEGWTAALDLRDKETEGHSQRVTSMCIELAKRMGISDQELANVRRGALLHDIGKMGVPDEILHKPARLNREEWVKMRQHPIYAFDMLSNITYLRKALDIPYCHHERWEGHGYPRGLKGEAIPLAARIFAVVDVYDALTSNRPYRKGWPKQRVLDYIRRQSGSHFDPQVVDSFLEMINSPGDSSESQRKDSHKSLRPDRL